ncbi:MAG: chemotaxis protein CheD [Spirochaetes bacterium]|nr:chemotaxis protein CheD [Spirochaetota bacterium]
MHVPHRRKFDKPVTIIQPGEYHVSDRDEMIGTLLGSCVAVCLHDPVRRVSGMNHFMLPGRIVKNDVFSAGSARYGISAITELLGMMEKRGAARRDMVAKIFGGGHVIYTALDSSTIPMDNVRLARTLLEIEDIPIVEMEVGGDSARKILMDVKSGKVFMKYVPRSAGTAQDGGFESAGGPGDRIGA